MSKKKEIENLKNKIMKLEGVLWTQANKIDLLRDVIDKNCNLIINLNHEIRLHERQA